MFRPVGRVDRSLGSDGRYRSSRVDVWIGVDVRVRSVGTIGVTEVSEVDPVGHALQSHIYSIEGATIHSPVTLDQTRQVPLRLSPIVVPAEDVRKIGEMLSWKQRHVSKTRSIYCTAVLLTSVSVGGNIPRYIIKGISPSSIVEVLIGLTKKVSSGCSMSSIGQEGSELLVPVKWKVSSYLDGTTMILTQNQDRK